MKRLLKPLLYTIFTILSLILSIISFGISRIWLDNVLFGPLMDGMLPRSVHIGDYLVIIGLPILIFIILQVIILKRLVVRWVRVFVAVLLVYTSCFFTIYLFSDEIAAWMYENNIPPFSRPTLIIDP